MESQGVGDIKTLFTTLTLPQGGWALEGGACLQRIDVAYETYGALNADKSNVVFVCHALTGDAHAAGTQGGEAKSAGWWDGFIGPGRGIDTARYFVVCANILGGCKGTTGPSSPHPTDGKPYGSRFPEITIGDIVAVHKLFLEQTFGISKVATVIGGSFGGMQVLEFALRFPDFIERAICIAAGACLAPQALAFDIVGRAAILRDPNWQGGDYYGGEHPTMGLALARQLAHITYISNDLMEEKFGRRRRAGHEGASDAVSPFEIESYLDYQGQKFIKRFDANSYIRISKAMADCDLERRFGTLKDAFANVSAKMLVVALSGDWLFLPEQSEALVEAMLENGKDVSYVCLDAPAGHDAFLTHIAPLISTVRAFLGGRVVAHKMPGNPERRTDYEHLLRLIPERCASALDLGCGDGTLLGLVRQHCGTSVTTGVDFALESALGALHEGHNFLLSDIDHGLELIPDNSYDCVLLSETLQVMKRPADVLKEMLRIAPVGIVSFPNFGQWSVRCNLFFSGRMPRTKRLPHEWHNTPNIHLCTLKDFLALCDTLGTHVDATVHLSTRRISKALSALGLPNLGASRVLVRITRSPH